MNALIQNDLNKFKLFKNLIILELINDMRNQNKLIILKEYFIII
jgi:hypothetical protein